MVPAEGDTVRGGGGGHCNAVPVRLTGNRHGGVNDNWLIKRVTAATRSQSREKCEADNLFFQWSALESHYSDFSRPSLPPPRIVNDHGQNPLINPNTMAKKQYQIWRFRAANRQI